MAYPRLDPCRSFLGSKIKACLEENSRSLSFSSDDIGRMLEKPPQVDMGDFALPCFRFAKLLSKSPQLIASSTAEALNKGADGWLAEAKPFGAFLNISIHQFVLAKHILSSTKTGEYFKNVMSDPDRAGERVMIEYSQPNTHKLFHVGHLRNVCLGHSLTRIFRYCGYDVVPVNYIGDEGTHIAECLWHAQRSGGQPPTGKSERVAWLEQHYASAKLLLAETSDDNDKAAFQREIGAILAEFEEKKGPFYEQWLETRAWCLEEFDRIYHWLSVDFAKIFFESEMTDAAQSIVTRFYEQGVFVKDQGAIGINLEADKLGFLILRKSNGTVPYASRDLALAERKFKDYAVSRSVYIVASEQNLHFQQVFKTLEKMGFDRAKDCFHLSYAFVRIPGGKMSTRKGNAIHFTLLQENLSEAFQEQLQKYQDQWSGDELQKTEKQLSVGAIMYGMLRSDPAKEIIFDIKEWTAFEGDTGPYLMYSYARAKSILRKLDSAVLDTPWEDIDWNLIDHPAEHSLLRHMYDLNDVVQSSCENYRPSTLANHLFYMCKELNRIYASVRINDAENLKSSAARAKLLEGFCISLKQGLYLLGIEPPERM